MHLIFNSVTPFPFLLPFLFFVHTTSHYSTHSTIEIWTYPKVSVCYERLPCFRVSHSFAPTLANETRRTDQLILCPILLNQDALISEFSGIKAFYVSRSTLACDDRPVLDYILRHCRGNLQMYSAEQRSPIYQPTGFLPVAFLLEIIQ